MIEELDPVALLVDHPELKLAKGQVGVAIVKHGNGEAFDVEFVDSEGYVYGEAALRADELLKLHHRAEAA